MSADVLNEIVSMSPDDVVLDDNVRTDPKLAPEFVLSVRERGVLVPLVAYRNPIGQVLLLDGQRRLLAARGVHLESVPVMLVDGPESPYSRISDQLLLNEARDALSTTERAEAVRQLELFGLKPNQIAKHTGISKKHVASLISVAGSPSAKKLVDELDDGIDIVIAARLAVLESNDYVDADRYEQLVNDIKSSPSQAEHYLTRVEIYAEDSKLIEEARLTYEDRGIRVFSYSDIDYKKHENVSSLRNAETGEDVDPSEHDSCPGNFVKLAVSLGSVSAYQYCEAPEEHGHERKYSSARSMSSEDKTAERKTTRENNKASDAARIVRISFLKDLLNSNVKYKGIEKFISLVATVSYGSYSQSWSLESPYGLLIEAGILKEGDSLTDYACKDIRNANRTMLASALATCEADMPRDFWRTTRLRQPIYMKQLKDWGYTLSPIEEKLLKNENNQ